MPVNWDWQNTWITTTNSSAATVYPYTYGYVQPQPLASVVDAPAELSDREWLDAQVAEVCELAIAA